MPFQLIERACCFFQDIELFLPGASKPGEHASADEGRTMIPIIMFGTSVVGYRRERDGAWGRRTVYGPRERRQA